MVGMELPKNPTRKQTKQPISVPFLWETKPGTPKENWENITHIIKPSRPPPPPPPHHPPIKLVASVPFEWEEKPGKPFPEFPKTQVEIYSSHEKHYNPFELTSVTGDENDNWEMSFESDLETFIFKTDEPLNSDPSNLDVKVRPSTPYPLIKLVASIPFEWEERPGKPLPTFISPTKSEIHYLPGKPISVNVENNSDNKSTSTYDRELISESDFETFSFETDESFHSKPALLANQVEPPPPSYPPIKLITSIPFEWEEKPGKPLPLFPLPTSQLDFYSSQDVESDVGNKSSNENESEDDSENNSESDFETISFQTDESFSSVPSLLANRLMPSVIISNAVPVEETTPSPQGYESDSSTCSYATGTTSLVGAPFLERLFPLLSPKINSFEKVRSTEKNTSTEHPTKVQSKGSDTESSFSVTVRRPATTLGELIMMSRRRSYIRKAVPIRRRNSMGSMKKKTTGCFMFGINHRIEGLQRNWKRQLQLKLI